MSDSKSTASGGIGLCGVLFVVFLALKLAEVGKVAAWSWWWVTAPLWGPFVLIVGVVLALLSARFLFGSFADIADARKRRRRLKDMYDND